MPMFLHDPITVAWAIALGALCALVVLIPLARLVLALGLHAYASVSGRSQLHAHAARVMPRIGHLIGGLLVGTATAVAAPAMATEAGVGIDRDSTVVTDLISAPAVRIDRDAPPTSTPSHEQAHTSRSLGTAVYVVRAGDTLWDIAAAQLDNPTDAQVTARWKAIWKANRAVIGDHPELIHPGDELRFGGRA